MSDDSINRKLEKAKLLFEQGLIKDFKELFDIVPYSVVAKKLKTNNVSFKAKMQEPTKLKLMEMIEIAAMLNINSVALCALVLQDPAKKEEV